MYRRTFTRALLLSPLLLIAQTAEAAHKKEKKELEYTIHHIDKQNNVSLFQSTPGYYLHVSVEEEDLYVPLFGGEDKG